MQDEIAYYYPEPYWRPTEGGWIKSLLLFFDQVAILLPRYLYGQHLHVDPTLAGPLEDRGLLRILEPEWFVDETTTEQLSAIVDTLIERGAFDDLSGSAMETLASFASSSENFAELSMSRMGLLRLREGTMGGHEALRVYDKLIERGLARPTQDGASIPMHRVVRAVYLLTIAQLAHDAGHRRGLDLHPVTSGRGMPSVFDSFLNLAPMPSRGQVVTFDIETVTIDLEVISLDEVLEFRRENRSAHRRYMQDLRRFTFELSMMEETDRLRAFDDRRADLEEQARELHRRATSAWRSTKGPASFGLGLAGAAWGIMTGNPVGAALSALGAGAAMLPDRAAGSAYSYLFAATRDLR